jgi:hypothetical protein
LGHGRMALFLVLDTNKQKMTTIDKIESSPDGAGLLLSRDVVINYD